MTLERSQQNPQATVDEVEARQVIKECDREIANYRAALRASPSDTVAGWIRETEDRRKAAGRAASEQTRSPIYCSRSRNR